MSRIISIMNILSHPSALLLMLLALPHRQAVATDSDHSAATLHQASSKQLRGSRKSRRTSTSSAPPLSGVTQRTNDLYLYGIEDISCNLISSSITPGQPFGGVSCFMQDNHGVIEILAGREGSTTPVNPFLADLSPSNLAVTATSSDHEPEELNFEAVIDLTFRLSKNGQTYTLSSFHAAQGHELGANNWWIGHSSFDCQIDSVSDDQYNHDDDANDGGNDDISWYGDDGEGRLLLAPKSVCTTSQGLQVRGTGECVYCFKFGLALS